MKATLDAIDHSDYELDFVGGQVASRGLSALPSYSVLRGVSEKGIEAAKIPRPITQDSVR
jgi:hypothetical protein